MSDNQAPGQPGMEPRWTSSAKDAVGTAVRAASDLWFTILDGIITEAYYAEVDRAAIRDFGLLITDGHDFFSDEKTDAAHEIAPLAQGVPGWQLTNTCREGRYRIVKEVIADPGQPILLTRVRFEALRGALSDYRLFALLNPHLGNQGADNSGRLDTLEDVPLLLAEKHAADGDAALALCCSTPFSARSCGDVGVSDGWQTVKAQGTLADCYDSAPNGNIALTGEISLQANKGEFVLVIGFGADTEEAAQRALTGMRGNFDEIARRYVSDWEKFQSSCRDLGAAHEDFYRMSVATLKTHDSKTRAGGMIASLSIPWGFAHGDKDLGGYHVIWPRDQVEGAGALLAAGDSDSARKTLEFLIHTQQEDGHWFQNMWLNGEAYWNGLQLDETALPILLADSLRRRDALGALDPWPTVRRAAAFLAQHGPSSPMDRWEENAGYTPFTLAVEIAALLAAADFADGADSKDEAEKWRKTADVWNDGIDGWTYVTDTPLAKRVGVSGYYVRIAPPDVNDQGGPAHAQITLKNRPQGEDCFPAAEIVSPDALALVRYGLRRPDDPRILNTIQVVDATLKVEMQTGPGWRRYTHDGYGDTADGGPFQGVGVGRCWPLLAGERAHYALAAGDRAEAERLLDALSRQTSPGGMLPEQVWDADDLLDKHLFNGKPAHSGMPLVWAHAELVKLCRSLHDGAVWDTPPQTVARYLKGEKNQ